MQMENGTKVGFACPYIHLKGNDEVVFYRERLVIIQVQGGSLYSRHCMGFERKTIIIQRRCVHFTYRAKQDEEQNLQLIFHSTLFIVQKYKKLYDIPKKWELFMGQYFETNIWHYYLSYVL